MLMNPCDLQTQRTVMQLDELNSDVQHSSPRLTGDEEKVTSTYDEAFIRITEATGVRDLQVEMCKEADAPIHVYTLHMEAFLFGNFV